MRSRVSIWLLGLAHAAMFALALPPFNVWPLTLAAIAPLAMIAPRAATTRQAVVAACLTQFFMWLWLLRWIIPVTIVGYPMLAAYMSIWPTVFVWMLRRVGQHPRFTALPMTLVVPVLWVAIEFFRGDVLFYGYPWYLLGHPLIAAPIVVQSADLFGTYFISFLAAMFSGLMVDAWRTRPTRTQRSVPSSSVHLPPRTWSSFVAFVVLANIGYGWWRMAQSDSLSSGPRVLAIQTSVPLDIKVSWTEEDQARDMQEFMALTRRALEHTSPPPDLIVWPETMVPGVGFESESIQTIRAIEDEYGVRFQRLYRWPLEVVQLQRELGIPMLVGSECWLDVKHAVEGNVVRLDSQRNYNSAYLIDHGPPFQRYDKYFLTPFGETMPYISAWPWLEQQLLKIGVSADLAFNLDSNPKVNLIRLRSQKGGEERETAGLADDVIIATPICFEDTVARFCRRMIHKGGEKQVDVVINISNDGWFHVSDADRRLHAMIARFRAIENRVPIVRSVNTGLSLSIDSAGRLIGAVGEGNYGSAREAGWVVADVQFDSRRTLSSRIGEAWPIVCLLLTAAAVSLTFIRPWSIAKRQGLT